MKRLRYKPRIPRFAAGIAAAAMTVATLGAFVVLPAVVEAATNDVHAASGACARTGAISIRTSMPGDEAHRTFVALSNDKERKS